MKKLLGVLLTVIICSATLNVVSEAEELSLKVVVDNEELTFPDAQPFVDNNYRTQTPARFIGEALGASVSWDGDLQQAKFVKGEDELLINIGSSTYQLNGVDKEMDTLPVIVDNRTFVPARYVAEAFGAEVGWDGMTKSVLVTSKLINNIEVKDDGLGYYDGISFDPLTDVDSYGSMGVEKTGEFVLKMAETVRFYEEDDVLYFSASYPELPDGFEYDFGVDVYFLDKASFGYFSYSRKEEALIPASGEFVKEARDQDSTEIDYIRVVIQVKDSVGYSSGKLIISTKSHDLNYPNEALYVHKNGGHNDIYTEHIDFEEIFQW